MATGDGIIPVRDGGSYSALTPGTSGDVLTLNGAGALPSYQTPGSGSGTVTNTGTLTDHEIVVANGGVDVSTLGSLGSSGQVLTSQGAGADPQWATPSSGTALTWIAELTPTGTNATFSSLGSFTHLRIVWSARGDQVATATNILLTFNADGGSNYDRESLFGSAATPGASEALGGTSGIIAVVSAASAPSGAIGSGEIVIPDYRGTAFNKSAISTLKYKVSTSSAGVFSRVHTVEWRSTAAITSIELTLASGNFVTGSKFTLYGMT